MGRNLAREVMLNDNFSLTKAIEDFFNVAHMFDIKEKFRYTGGPIIITKHLTPNLRNYTARVNKQVCYRNPDKEERVFD